MNADEKVDEARRQVAAGNLIALVEKLPAHKRVLTALAMVYAELRLLNENLRGKPHER